MANPLDTFAVTTVRTNDLRVPKVPRTQELVVGLGMVQGLSRWDSMTEEWRANLERQLNERLATVDELNLVNTQDDRFKAIESRLAILEKPVPVAQAAAPVDLSALEAADIAQAAQIATIILALAPLQAFIAGHEWIATSWRFPNVDQTIPAGHSAIVAADFEIGTDLVLELEIDSVFEIL